MNRKGLKEEAESMEIHNTEYRERAYTQVVPTIVVSDLGLKLALRF